MVVARLFNFNYSYYHLDWNWRLVVETARSMVKKTVAQATVFFMLQPKRIQSRHLQETVRSHLLRLTSPQRIQTSQIPLHHALPIQWYSGDQNNRLADRMLCHSVHARERKYLFLFPQ